MTIDFSSPDHQDYGASSAILRPRLAPFCLDTGHPGRGRQTQCAGAVSSRRPRRAITALMLLTEALIP